MESDSDSEESEEEHPMYDEYMQNEMVMRARRVKNNGCGKIVMGFLIGLCCFLVFIVIVIVVRSGAIEKDRHQQQEIEKAK